VLKPRGRARLPQEHVHERLLLGEVGQNPFQDDQALGAADAALARKQQLGHAPCRDARDDLESIDAFPGRS
jgi:hypothetical protein